MNMEQFLASEPMAGLMDIDEYNDGADLFWTMVKGTRINKTMMDWLESIGYFLAPAAVKHHGNYPGGLLMHSIEVAEQLVNITKSMGLEWDRKDSPLIVGLLHDLCKVDEYYFETEEEARLFVLDRPVHTGKSSWKPAYNKNQMYKGHAGKSIDLINRFAMEHPGKFYLTPQEEMCIRFHMGAFTASEEWKYYSEACRMDANVLWTHTADMLASSRGI